MQHYKNFGEPIFKLKKIYYEKLLTNPDEEVKGTVKELAEKYEIDVFTMTGFLDGINESLKERIQLRQWKKIQL